MHRLGLLYFAFVFLMFESCRAQKPCCDLEGHWIIKEGRFFENYEHADDYVRNRVIFRDDTVELASGFFYNTTGLNDPTPEGRFSYVYYGNKELYRIKDNKFFVFSKPYNEWTEFDMKWRSYEELTLIGQEGTIILERSEQRSPRPCKIKSIHVKVHLGTLDINDVAYEATFTNDGRMIYEDQSPTANTFKLPKKVNISPKTFEEICDGFSYVDLDSIKPVYEAKYSEFKLSEYTIVLEEDETIQFKMQDPAMNVPDELTLALIPVSYLHQMFTYPELPAKRYNDK